jgi:phosphatidylglycerol lysyltransferase
MNRRRADADRARVLSLLRAHGWNATSFQVLEEGFRYAFDERVDACVAYIETGGAWVVAGAPIAAPSECAEVCARFLARAGAARRRTCFFAVEDRFLHATRLPSMRVGEQPVWDATRWDECLHASKSLREQLRRARAKGVVARAVEAETMGDPQSPERRAAETTIARWVASRGMAPMGFLVDVQPFAFPSERRYFVAEHDRRVVAFLACVPVYAREGWLLEDLLRDPRAPNGTAELVVDAAMRALAREGASYVTFGLAPLAGPVSGWLRTTRAWTRALYDFEGVRAFKAKFRPHAWEPIHLAYPRGASPTGALFDALAAFARGSFARFGFETLLHGPAIVVRALATMLVPWTALVAMAPASWFPFRWVHPAWVAFDAILAIALFALARRWRERLALALAIVITLDAFATWCEALAFGGPHRRGADGWVVALVAALAPTLASLLLWSAIGHRAWMREMPPLASDPSPSAPRRAVA